MMSDPVKQNPNKQNQSAALNAVLQEIENSFSELNPIPFQQIIETLETQPFTTDELKEVVESCFSKVVGIKCAGASVTGDMQKDFDIIYSLQKVEIRAGELGTHKG